MRTFYYSISAIFNVHRPPPNPQVDLSAGVFCVWLVR